MQKHLPDDLDIFIWKEIFKDYHNNNESNNWEISKKYAKKIKEKDIDKIYRKIRARLKEYCHLGIFEEKINGDKKPIFEMDLNQITFAKHKFEEGFKECVLIRVQL